VVGGPEIDEDDGVCNACARFTEGDWSNSNDLRFSGVIDSLGGISSGSGLEYRGILKLLSRREGVSGLVYLAACARSSSRLDLSRMLLKKVVGSCWEYCLLWGIARSSSAKASEEEEECMPGGGGVGYGNEDTFWGKMDCACALEGKDG
jgi:hypothetical protein